MTTATARRPLDRADASWATIDYTRTLWGTGPVDPARLRTAVRTVLERSPQLARDLDPLTATWRQLTEAERGSRAERMVLSGAACATAEEADAAAAVLPLEGMPFRILVGPDYLSLRTNHVFGDEWSTVTVLVHLLAQSHSPAPLELPWTEVSSARRRRLTAWQLVTRPGAVATAVRRRRALAGGPFEPGRLNADRLAHRCTHVVSPEGFLSGLRAERAARGLDVSLAAVSLVGLRGAIAAHLEPPIRGAEVVYDVRREAALTRRALGNWVAGVFVVPEDDTDVVSVHRAVSAIRTQGIHLVAAAAARRRVLRGDHGSRLVFAPEAGLRLTLSYIPGHGPLRDAPLRAGHAAYFGTNPPNGVNTLTLTCAEVGDRMHLGVQHYDEVWSRDLVLRAASAFFADPWADHASPRRRET